VFAKTLLSFAAALLLASITHADDNKRYTLSPAYIEECGSCHTAFPAQLLPASGWVTVMAGLANHFDTDASLTPAKAAEIGHWLAANAAGRDKFDAIGLPLRLTKTRWFLREHRDGHDGLSASVWKSAAVKTPANCVACHRNADTGDYSERDLRVPR
jgi:hypothetical protein